MSSSISDELNCMTGLRCGRQIKDDIVLTVNKQPYCSSKFYINGINLGDYFNNNGDRIVNPKVNDIINKWNENSILSIDPEREVIESSQDNYTVSAHCVNVKTLLDDNSYNVDKLSYVLIYNNAFRECSHFKFPVDSVVNIYGWFIMIYNSKLL
jgi:hypothetical protein